MKVLITGSNGFVGRNLAARLRENSNFEILEFNRKSTAGHLSELISRADFLVHLAATNRSSNEENFKINNVDLTKFLCEEMVKLKKEIPIIFSSSTQYSLNNSYGKSKKESEKILENYSRATNNSVTIYRFPGIFGKWSKPNYNSVVATFCHNIANLLPINISDPKKELRLVYIDDVINELINSINNPTNGISYGQVNPEYAITIEDLAKKIKGFRDDRLSLHVDNVGVGITRALYSTYISYLPQHQFSYPIPCNIDERGVFVQILKTNLSGQMSFLTAKPGETRGGHYHNSKVEKFLVVKGSARFCFINIVSQERLTITTSGERPEIVETIPGWAHDITNVGADEMIVFLWANEIFDIKNPDTYKYKMNT